MQESGRYVGYMQGLENRNYPFLSGRLELACNIDSQSPGGTVQVC